MSFKEFIITHWALILSQLLTLGGIIITAARWSKRIETDLVAASDKIDAEIEKIELEIGRRMTREDCLKMHQDCGANLEKKFASLSADNQARFGEIWRDLNALVGDFRELRGELKKAVELLETGIKRINGKAEE